jgi:magnesium-transporting ATPase (P-type)
MKQTIKLLPLLVPFFFFTAYLHLNFFYEGFGINIEQWVSIDELIILFFNDLATFLFYSILIFMGSYATLRIKDYVNEEGSRNLKGTKEQINQRKIVIKIFGLFAPIIVIGVTIWAIVFRLPETYFEKLANIILALSVLIVLVPALLMREIMEEWLSIQITNYSILFTIFCLSFVSHSFVNALKKQRNRLASDEFTFVVLNTQEKIDSLIYLGKTDGYFFLYNKRKRKVSVFEKSRINRLNISEKNKGSFDLYQ